MPTKSLQNIKIDTKTPSFNIFDEVEDNKKIFEKNSSIIQTDSIIPPEALKKFEKSKKLTILEKNTKDKANYTTTTPKTLPIKITSNCDKASVLAISTIAFNPDTINQNRLSLLKQVS